ncbi:MAG TPA: hypothetical protein VMA72_29675 [Streptosporangiaceae bacterium]|nr:hypothetical protein [Streptosporangiaceae bacterium]
MPAGETAPAEYRDHLRSCLARGCRQIKVAIAERADSIGSRRVVPPDVLPPALAGMGKPAVQLNGRQVSRVEDIAVLVVVAAAISALSFAGWQAVRTLDVFVVSPFQNRVQAGRIEGQQFGEFRPPAQLDSALDCARQVQLRGLPALQAAEYPGARIIDRSSRISKIENRLLDPRLRWQPGRMTGLRRPGRVVNDEPGCLRGPSVAGHGHVDEVTDLVDQPG